MVQRRANILIPGLKDVNEERLRKVQSPIVVYRRCKGDIIEICDIFRRICDTTFEPVTFAIIGLILNEAS